MLELSSYTMQLVMTASVLVCTPHVLCNARCSDMMDRIMWSVGLQVLAMHSYGGP